MYICNYCGEIFEEAAYERQDMGEYWGAAAYEYVYVCPHCGEADFEAYNEDAEEAA